MAQTDTNAVFKNLKKHNGEAVAKLIRDNQLLDIPNIEHILEFAGHDPEDIKKLVHALRSQYKIISASLYDTKLDPLELLDRAGYDAFVVTNFKQQNSIKKYFRPDEELCTFNDETRYKDYYIIHAIKRGADKIKPSTNPERQDEYGTSVISIQISKTGGAISIKNRYNHTVNNPDATFNNNPDNIIIGLTNSLQKFFGVQFNVLTVEIPDNYRLIEDQFVKYNYEIDNVYFGANYYFTGDKITKINTGYQVMLDYMILDEKEKKIISPIHDYTYDVFCEAFNGKTITRTTEKDKIIITTQDGNRVVVKNGKIIELELPTVTKIGDHFLADNDALIYVNLPKVKKIGNNFLYEARFLENINLPSVTAIGVRFLANNERLTSLDLPEVKSVGYSFLKHNNTLTSINIPNVELIDYEFLASNNKLTSINLPKVKTIGTAFLSINNKITSLNLPEVKHIKDSFLRYNKVITSINAPKLMGIEEDFLRENNALTSLSLPNVRRIGGFFLDENQTLEFLSLPKLESINIYHLPRSLTAVELPETFDRWAKSMGLSLKDSKAKKFKDLKDASLAKNQKTKKIKNATRQISKKIAKRHVANLDLIQITPEK